MGCHPGELFKPWTQMRCGCQIRSVTIVLKKRDQAVIELELCSVNGGILIPKL